MGNTGRGVVVPFPGARASLWTAQSDRGFGSAREAQRLATRIIEELDRAEEGLKAVEAALDAPHPAPARLGRFVRGELSREENRALIRHLLTGCPECAAVLRPLVGPAGLPLPRAWLR
jgi:hypothetical protein